MENQKYCSVLIKQIYDEMEKRANNRLRVHDLTMAQLGALLAIDKKPEKQMSLKELERELHVAQSTAVGIIYRLEKKRFVEGFGDPSDRRIKMVRITSAGSKCCGLAESYVAKEEALLLSCLTELEQNSFMCMLQKVQSTFA